MIYTFLAMEPIQGWWLFAKIMSLEICLLIFRDMTMARINWLI